MYQVFINNQFINSFKSYSKAVELRENFLKRFKNANVEIRAI